MFSTVNDFVNSCTLKSWLVKTVSILLIAVSASFFAQLLLKKNELPVYVLADSCCMALAGIDCYYVFLGIISPIYLFDALVEILLLLLYYIFRKKYHYSNFKR